MIYICNPRARRHVLHVERLEDRRLLVAAAFTDVASAVGLSGLVGGSGEYHAGGLVFTDLNTDGFADLYLIGPSSRGNRLYINVDSAGQRSFVRAVSDGGTGYGLGNSTGAVAADYDNDGDLDIYLTNFGSSNALFKNMWMEDHPSGVGDPLSLRFVNTTATTDPTPGNPGGDTQHGVGYATFQNPDSFFGNDVLNNSMAAAWADVNRDGFVDLYVGSWDGTNGDPGTAEDGQLGERDTLYLNNGDGTFTDVTMDQAAAAPSRLVDDGSFADAVTGTQTSGSDWLLTVQGSAAQFQTAAWAASEGDTGVWFQGFRGSASNPVDAQLRQVVTAPTSGDYTLRFDAKVESDFPSVVDGFRVSITSNGTGGTAMIDLLAAPADAMFHSYTLQLDGVTAGDQLTLLAEMIDASGGSGPELSGMLDGFVLSSPQLPQHMQASPLGGWEYFEGGYNDRSLPAEFSGHNALQFADFNNDGWQDLIVATMGGGSVGPNRDMLYLNLGLDAQQNWMGYKQVSYELGFGGNESSDMGVAVADVDNDGDLDYFSTLLPDAHPLWINQLTDTGDFSFSQSVVNNTFSWGANFHDFDNNGRVDLLVGTDIGRRSYLHLQDENGNLIESGIPAGLTSTYTIRGVAVADYDRDGWSDAALWSSSGSNPGIQLYRNDSESSNGLSHFLTLDLQGDPSLPGPLKSTRDAIGARVYITADFNGDGSIGTDETRIEEVLSGHSNASTTSSLALEFGLGLATTADVRIVWGSGHQTRMDNVAADQFLTIVEAFPPGDFDFDEDLDGEDIDLLVAAIADGAADAALFDLTGDGLVNLQDRDEWLALAGSRNLASGSSYLIGDANLDGIVDGQDFVVWNTNKFSNTAAWTAGDFSADGIVDGQDFVLWNLNKFTSAALGASANTIPFVGRHGQQSLCGTSSRDHSERLHRTGFREFESMRTLDWWYAHQTE